MKFHHQLDGHSIACHENSQATALAVRRYPKAAVIFKRSSLILALLVSLTLLLTPSAFAQPDPCFESVKQKRYERLGTVCLDLPHRDRLKKMQLVMSGLFEHSLGTIKEPSLASQQLRIFAAASDRQAQYIYGYLYRVVHTASDLSWPEHPSNDGTITMLDHNKMVKEESFIWLRRAAEGGHTLAMLEVAESELLRSYTSSDIDLNEALQIATQANNDNPVLAKDLIGRIKKRIQEYN